METLYRARSWFASAPSILLFLAAVALTISTTKPVKPKHEQPPMKVTIAEPPQEQPAPPPQPTAMPQLEPLQPPTPDIQLPPMPKLSQRPTPTPVPPRPQEQPTAAAPTEPTTTANTAAVAPAPPAPPAPARAASASQDDAYTAQIKAYLESLKHYPTSKEARLQRPRGTVEVWFVLDRSGGVKEAGIETSSGSLILDGAALSLVRSSSYPAFPAEAFKSEANHRFTVHLNYTLA